MSGGRALARWCEAHHRRLALGAVAVSLIIGGVVTVWLGDAIRFHDEQEYVSLARSLAAGTGYSYDGVHPTAYRPPGYPLLLAPLSYLGGGEVAVLRLLGVAALAGSVWLGYLLGLRVGGPSTGMLAAWVMAGYPLIGYTATTLYPQVTAMFLVLLQLELGCRAGFGPTSGRWSRCAAGLGSGLAGGWLVLTVPTFAPAVLVVFGWLFWRGGRGCRGVVAAAVTIALLVPAGWAARNAVQLPAFVPMSTNAGLNLLLGNNERAGVSGGTERDLATDPVVAALPFDSVERDNLRRDEAVRWIEANPGQAGLLYLGKVANTFAFRNDLATPGRGGALTDAVSALTFYPLLGLALLRLVRWRRRPLHDAEVMAVAVLVLGVLLQAVFFTRMRFRVPLDALIILLACATIGPVLARWGNAAPDGARAERDGLTLRGAPVAASTGATARSGLLGRSPGRPPRGAPRPG